MGLDDDTTCVEHVWVLKGMHLSVLRGVEQTEECARCGATRHLDDRLRNTPRRPKLPPTRPLAGE